MRSHMQARPRPGRIAGGLPTVRLTAVVLFAGAVAVSAHLEPILPSTCAFDPLELRVPAAGLSGTATGAGPTDVVRITYDASASQLQVCGTAGGDGTHCASVPRAFILGGVSGTLALPALFKGTMLASGDVTIPDLPLTLTAGAATSNASVTFTTALVSVDGRVVQGRPLQESQGLTLIGVVDGAALPAPLAGRSLLLSLSCLPQPFPDEDQFALPLMLASIRGNITGTGVRLHAVADVESAPPDLTRGPTLVAITVDGTTIATAVIPGGLQGARKVLTGRSADGRTTITVRRTRRNTGTRLAFDARLGSVTLPSGLRRRALVDVTLDAGGVIGRGERRFRVTKGGRRLSPG